MGTAVIVDAIRSLRSRRHSEREDDVVLRLPVRLCTSTCIPQVNSAAIRIGSFAFKNSNRQCKNHEGGKLSPLKLQGRYMAALSRIAGAPMLSVTAILRQPEILREVANDISVLGLGESLQSFCGYIAERPN